MKVGNPIFRTIPRKESKNAFAY